MPPRKRMRKNDLVDDEADEVSEVSASSSRAPRVRVNLSSFGSPPRPKASGDPKHVLIKPVNNHGLIKIEFPFDEEVNKLLRALVTANG